MNSGVDATVTVVIVCYNHERFIDGAIDSALAQTYRSTEIVIVDDRSTDRSVDRISDKLAQLNRHIQFIEHERNLGLCATLNEVRGRISTDYVAFIAADDLMEPDRIERQVAMLETRGDEYAFVYGDAFRMDVEGKRQELTLLEHEGIGPEMPEGSILIDLLRGSPVPAPTVLMRREALESVGPYDEDLPFEDFDMWLRLAREYKVAYLADPLVSYRQHHGSMFDELTREHDRLRWGIIESLLKQRGFSAEADQIIGDRVTNYLWALYRHGASLETLARASRRQVLRRPSVRIIAVSLLASLRISDARLGGVRRFLDGVRWSRTGR